MNVYYSSLLTAITPNNYNVLYTFDKRENDRFGVNGHPNNCSKFVIVIVNLYSASSGDAS